MAIMAADFWVSVLGARSHSYAIRAGDHGLMEAHNRWIIEEIEAGRLFYSGPMDQLTLRANRCRRLIAYHAYAPPCRRRGRAPRQWAVR